MQAEGTDGTEEVWVESLVFKATDINSRGPEPGMAQESGSMTDIERVIS